MRIIPYADAYRDDMIFMILEAKDALGRVPTLNPDLLDIQRNYFDKGDMFWLALSDAGRVIGSVGYSAIPGTDSVWLHRFYVKAALKRQGIGTALYLHAEEHIRKAGKARVRIHLGGPGYEASRLFYRHFGYEYEQDENYMVKILRSDRNFPEKDE
ncbi:MAG: GNAT family N-acetyltransferase [Clostridia bacterium]|nr:GNAT family N-acetyltransferase [Clostridia bacterium]MBR0408950.1 GNAT family N-acetyltransferase [Clostridia bacterium]